MNRSNLDGFDWLIDKRSALREQFPAKASVMRERPGSAVDKDNRHRFAIENRRSLEHSRAAVRAHEAQEKDADRFIAEMKRREHERMMARLAARHPERRKTA